MAGQLRNRSALLATAVAAAITFSAIGSVPASAAPRPTIAEVEARVADLNERAEGAAEQYNAGRIELLAARDAQRRSQQSLDAARRAMTGQRGAIGQMASDAYRSGGSEQSSLAVLMMADDPAAAFQKLSTISAIQRQQASTLRRVEVVRQKFAQAQAESADRTMRAESLAADLETRKSQVESLLDQARRQLEQLTAEERARIVAARQARAQADAAVAARFLAEQRQQASAASRAPRTEASSNPGTGGTGPAPAPSTRSTPGGGNKAAGAVQAALSKLGTPYVWGAGGPNSFDCSGLIMWAYAQVGVSVPHYTGSIWNGYQRVAQSDLRPGDIVFFFPDVHHAGIYLGGGKMVHAPSTGDVVKISEISPVYWTGVYTGAVRIVG